MKKNAFDLTEHQKKVIVILDDNKVFTENLKDNITDMITSDDDIGDFIVETVNNISELYIDNYIKKVDVLVIDYELGEANNGIEVVKDLREKTNNVPVVLITGDDINELQKNNKDVINIEFIQKGDSEFYEKLVAIIENKLKDRIELIYQKIEQYISAVNGMFFEREEVSRLNMLALFSAENIFYLGPPGTGKSAIVDTVINCLPEVPVFRQLMTEFTKFDTIFGDVITTETGMKKRVLDGRAVSAFIIFLDEIFKGSDQILNALLTLLNEKKFDDFDEVIRAILRVCVGASNEFPRSSYLKALFERFFFRVMIPQVEKKENIAKLLAGEMNTNHDALPKFSLSDFYYVDKYSKEVLFGEEVQTAFFELRDSFYKRINADNENTLNKVYEFSSRTVYKAGKILQVCAFINRRKKVQFSDLFILRYATWGDMEQKRIIEKTMDNIIFGDRDNTVEKIEKDLKEYNELKVRYKQNFQQIIDYNKKLKAKEYEKALIDIKYVLKKYQEVIEKFNSHLNLLNYHREIINEIEENIIICEESVVPWNLNLEILKEKKIGEMNRVIDEVDKGLFKNHIHNTYNELKQEIVKINEFLNEDDYYMYCFENNKKSNKIN